MHYLNTSHSENTLLKLLKAAMFILFVKCFAYFKSKHNKRRRTGKDQLQNCLLRTGELTNSEPWISFAKPHWEHLYDNLPKKDK